MICINGKVISIDKFPDGTLLLKGYPPKNRLGTRLFWRFENNEEFVALIFITRHLRAHGVNNIDLFMPYIPNARQDRVKNEEDVFTLKYFADIINSLAFKRVIVLDPHSHVSEALFNRIEIMSPKHIVSKIYDKICTENENVLMFYPDEGAMKRYSGMISAPYAFGIKERDWNDGKIKNLSIFDGGQSVAGKTVLIVDDICSRGGTFCHSAKKLKELGAAKVFLYVTHCENTILDGDVLTSGLIERVYTTNSLFTQTHEKIEVIEL